MSNITTNLDNQNILSEFNKCDIFTPDKISKLMTSRLLCKGNLLEPSVGTGNLLKYINIDNYESIDVYEIKNKYLQEIKEKEINKFNEDFIKANITKKYDNIILNPPYIKIQDLSKDYRKYLKKKFKILEIGLVDIYYAFLIKCLDLLNDDGVMISITPNTYLYNKSAYELRKYFFENEMIKEIIDFKDKKVFDNASVYCCITIFTKTKKSNLIYNDNFINYSDIKKNYSLFNFNSNEKTLKNICKITNGIATLRDKIFIHSKKLFNEPCWKEITNGPCIKSIIYPYHDMKIIDENIFKDKNPLTYEYLKKNKDELAQRDKGNKIYPAWYAYGRSQSIKIHNKKCIYIPCFINPRDIEKNIFVNSGILHQGCLCIEPFNEDDLEMIKEILKKNIDFIYKNSSKRSGGWINISSRILYQIILSP